MFETIFKIDRFEILLSVLVFLATSLNDSFAFSQTSKETRRPVDVSALQSDVSSVGTLRRNSNLQPRSDVPEYSESISQNLTPPSSPRRAEELSPSFSRTLPYVAVLGNVVCQSNFSFSETDDLYRDVENLQEDLVRYLGVPYPNEKIELCLFANSESYVSFIKDQFPGAPLDRPALYIKSGGPGVLMVKKDANIRLNIRHEMTHAILNASLRNVPIWLDEGLAKYFEIPPGNRGYGSPFLPIVKSSGINFSFLSNVPSLPRLEKLYSVQQMREREYKESWAWIHFLIHYSPETQKLLAQYLQTLTPERQKGISLQESIERQKSIPLTVLLETQIPNYKDKYLEHFKLWKKRLVVLEKNRRSEMTIPGTAKR